MTIATPTRKDEICEAIVDYVAVHGISDLSLRPLAEHLGTSPRMLLYHFESKERMLAEVLAAARARQYAMLKAWGAEGITGPDLLRRYWEWAASDEARPYMQLFFEVFGLAVQQRPGTEGVLEAITSQAIAMFTPAAPSDGLSPAAAEQIARLGLATLRGLLFDLLATADRPPLDAAFETFMQFLQSITTPEKGEFAMTATSTLRPQRARQLFDIRVVPASTPAAWADARRVCEQMIAWLGNEVHLDVRTQQHDSVEELESLPDFYRFPEGIFFVGYVDGVACGHAGVHMMDETTAELRRVWVTPEARGIGLASDILAAGLAGAKTLGANEIWLETVRGPMDRAIGMYRRAGFKEIPHYTSMPQFLDGVLALGRAL